jgi:monoamine oxidase
MSASKELPVGIVGAGMSGLVAAFHLTQQGIPVRIFEARERIGGRIMTVSEDGCPLPLELGAEFIHGAAEPAMALADATDVAVQHVAHEHVRFVDGKFRSMPDLWARYAKILDGAEKGPDQSATDYLKRKHPSGSDAELFRLIVEGFEAAPADDVSVQSLAREAEGLSKGKGELRPVQGFGAMCKALLHRLSSGLVDLHLNAAVEAIAWRPDGRCALRVREHEATRAYETMRCVITLPLGVLQSSSEKGSLRFSPEVNALSAPLSLLAMGHVVKLVLILREHPFMKSLPDTDFFHLPSGNFPTFWQQRLPDLRVITAWIGGSKARAIEALDTRDLLDQVASDLADCCQVLPGEIRDSLVAAHHHDFSRDPYSLGAYPYVRPEGAAAIRALAAPVEKALFFAGDATDPEHIGTVAGAIASGARAARQLISL